MALKDRIESDNKRVFVNFKEFATLHSWGSKEILCVIDDDNIARQNCTNILENSWENNLEETILYVQDKEIGYRPTAREQVYFDGMDMVVVHCRDNMGIYEIMLRSNISRGIL